MRRRTGTRGTAPGHGRRWGEWRRRRPGFTLLEVVIALGILSIGIVSVMACFPVAFQALKRSGDAVLVSFLAQDRLAELNRLVEDSAAGWDGLVTGPASPFPPPYDRFSWETQVETVGDVKRVTLTIAWRDGGRTRRERFLTSFADLYP